MARKVIIDADPGVSDAVALTIALFDPRLEIVAITAVAGAVSAEQATRNVQTIVDQLDPPRLPRVGAAIEPERNLPTNLARLHGENGLGNAKFPVAELHQRHLAEKIMFEEIRSAPNSLTILALGPLTNVSLALSRDPAMATNLGELVILGGAVECPGDVTPTAEFNIYCDPNAASAVFESAMTKRVVPLDVTRQVTMSFDFLNQLPDEFSRAGRFLRQILPYSFRAHHEMLGLEEIFLHEAVALVATLHPELFTWQEMRGDVETAGDLTMGMTVFDRRARPQRHANLSVARELDPAGVRDAILRGLDAAAQAS